MTTAPLERLDVVNNVDGLSDFAVPCDTDDHGDNPPSAEWITWYRPCCPPRPLVVLYCTPCLEGVLAHLGYRVVCSFCGKPRGLLRTEVTRWEPIDRRPGPPH